MPHCKSSDNLVLGTANPVCDYVDNDKENNPFFSLCIDIVDIHIETSQRFLSRRLDLSNVTCRSKITLLILINAGYEK